MAKTELEQEIDKRLTEQPIKEGLSAIPGILGCSALTYLLNFAGCIDQVKNALPQGLNLGFHLATGSGIYGGQTKNINKRIASLVTLVSSFTPEIISLAQDGDFEKIATSAGVKAVGYGLGYIAGYFFR